MNIRFKRRTWHEVWECDDPQATVHISFRDGMAIEWEVQVARHAEPHSTRVGLCDSFEQAWEGAIEELTRGCDWMWVSEQGKETPDSVAEEAIAIARKRSPMQGRRPHTEGLR